MTETDEQPSSIAGDEATDARDDLRANLPRLPPPTVIGGNEPIVRPKMETRGR